MFRKTNSKRVIFFLFIDGVLLGFSLYVSFWLRFAERIPQEYFSEFCTYVPLFVAVSIFFLYREGLYRASWSYIRLGEMVKLGRALSYSFLALGAFILLMRHIPPFSGFPRSVLLINYPLSILLVGLFRLSKRIYLEILQKKPPEELRKQEKVLVVGAGDAGEQIIQQLLNENSQYLPVGLVDDDLALQGISIHGVRVLGKREDIPRLIREYQIDNLLIAMPSAASRNVREIIEVGRKAGVSQIRILPSLSELISGKVTLAQLREVQLKDLLAREPVEIDIGRISSYLKDTVVMVTGAAGSIGSELCRQILRFSPRKLILVDQDETALFHIQRHLQEVAQGELITQIADVRCPGKMERIIAQSKTQIIFHAAAYKHVPMMEDAPDEAVKNNVMGVLSTGKAAIRQGVKKFVFISTDKAVNPISVMGMSKRLGELVVTLLNQEGKTRFCAVRFGNVLGSRGSVVPLFEEQIRRGGPVMVTDLKAERYFMITSEAALLVLGTGALGKGGEIFALDMGKPVKIIDLAREMIKLSGLQPNVDIPITFSGLRPGEKLSEMVFTPEEKAVLTEHPKILKIEMDSLWPDDHFRKQLVRLKDLAEQGENKEIVRLMRKLCEESFKRIDPKH